MDPSTARDLPTFVATSSNDANLASLSYFRTLSPAWFSETRLAYTRYASDLPAGEFEFPGLDSFPNISIEQDLDLQIGPSLATPQSDTQNTYQIVQSDRTRDRRNWIRHPRALTSAFTQDQHLPYSIQWNAGFETLVAEHYTVSARYLGTRGVRLFTQADLPLVARANPGLSLPTFFARPPQSELDALDLTLAQIDAQPFALARYTDAGFGPVIYTFLNHGNSIYHSLAAEAKRRFSNGLQFIGAYTWSKNIDDSTADLFSTLLSPRRPQDFHDMRAERGRSFLDRTHRFTLAWVYEVPWYRNSGSWLRRNVLGNWVLAGMYTAESPQYATVQSGLDSNRNLDGATDRVVVNPDGRDRTGSAVTPLTNSGGDVVGYLADNPNARYVKAGAGVHPNGGRNTLPLRGINNFDCSVSKRVAIGESKAVEFRAAFYNALNHPQFAPGSLNSVRAVSSNVTRNNLIPGHALFDRPDQVYDSHAREIRLVLRFTF